MKKIILIAFFGILAVQARSQDSPGGFKVMTIEEANKLNGPGQPIINGKPYSQHKAEQEALKRQKEANNASLPAGLVAVNSSTAKPVAAQPASAPKFENDGYTKPAPVVTEQAIVGTTAPAKKETEAPVIIPTASVRTTTIAVNSSTPVAGDAGLNVPAGAVNGSVMVTPDKPAEQQKPATRSPAEIEAAKKLETVAKAQAATPVASKTSDGNATAVKPMPAPARQD